MTYSSIKRNLDVLTVNGSTSWDGGKPIVEVGVVDESQSSRAFLRLEVHEAEQIIDMIKDAIKVAQKESKKRAKRRAKYGDTEPF
jgi:hypothetical protein